MVRNRINESPAYLPTGGRQVCLLMIGFSPVLMAKNKNLPELLLYYIGIIYLEKPG